MVPYAIFFSIDFVRKEKHTIFVPGVFIVLATGVGNNRFNLGRKCGSLPGTPLALAAVGAAAGNVDATIPARRRRKSPSR